MKRSATWLIVQVADFIAAMILCVWFLFRFTLRVIRHALWPFMLIVALPLYGEAKPKMVCQATDYPKILCEFTGIYPIEPTWNIVWHGEVTDTETRAYYVPLTVPNQWVLVETRYKDVVLGQFCARWKDRHIQFSKEIAVCTR